MHRPRPSACYFPLCIIYLTLVLVSQVAVAQPDDPVDFKKMASLVVEVVDDQGQPIEGATVYPYAMRAVENANGHGYWNDDLIGPPKLAATDSSGKATIQYPVHIGSPTEPRTTGLVTFEIKHTDYVRSVTHFDLGPDVAKVEMKAGCEIQLSAIDANGQAIPEFMVVVAGSLAPDYWASDGQGGRRTRSASDGTWQTMLVKSQDAGPTLFSNILPLRVRPDQDVKIRNIKLLPGTRVTGKLSDNVPRPIKAGYVIATCAPKPAENAYAAKDPSLVWHDWTEIREDGSFEFASLPRGGEMQLIAISNGWLSTTIPAQPNGFTQGQLFQLDKAESQFDLTLEMEATGTIELTVLGPDKTPLSEGEVSSWPNQLYLKGGSTLLGSRHRSMESYQSQLLPPRERKPIRFRRDEVMPYQGKLVDGKVTLKGIPLRASESLALRHPKYVFKGAEGEAQIKLDSSDPKSITLRAGRPSTIALNDPMQLLDQAAEKLKAILTPKQPAKGEEK